MEAQVNSHYISKKFIKNTAITSALEGSKMGVQQALGLIVVEFFTALFEEISDMYHNGFFVDTKGCFKTLKNRLKKYNN